MKHLRSFFSFTAPLIIMLVTFCIYLIVNKVVHNYKDKITNDYSIIMVSNTPFSKIDEVSGIKIRDIKILKKDKIIEDIRNELSDSSLDLLNKKLPYFYQIYLEEFPTTLKLEEIRKELITISNVKRVETFTSDHNKVYSLLILIQDIIIILFVITLLLSILLISKQIKIWFFEQSERISIIQLHGGSLLYSSKPIIKIMVTSAVTSIIFVSILLFLTINNISLFVRPEILMLIPKITDLEFDILKIMLLAISIPMVTFLGLAIQHKVNS